jgi:catechol 2,3-dioxygenase-like lactoylglutathione lyase family enzyme
MGNEFRCAFFTDEYESTVSFYRDLLEFQVGESWDRASDDKGAIFLAGSGMIEVLTKPGHERSWVWSKEKPRGFAIVIELDDVDGFYTRILEKEIVVAAAIADWEWAHRSFRIEDPNGVTLYFYSEIEGVHK